MRSSRRQYRNYQYGKKKKFNLSKIIFFFILLFLFVSFLDTMIISSYRSGSIAMEPVIPKGSYVLATPLIYGAPIPFTKIQIPSMHEPRRGEVVVVVPPNIPANTLITNLLNGVVSFFTLRKISLDSTEKRDWENREVIKRVIAVPGDTVRMQDFKVEIKKEGENKFVKELTLMEALNPIYMDFPSFWDHEHPFSGNLDEVTLGEGEYFLLGDNRGQGLDSSYLGVYSRHSIKKLVFLKYWQWPPQFL